MPFWFILNDIVTEVYGYKIARQIFWYAILCNIMFAIVVTILLQLPSPESWSGEAHYAFVFKDMLRLAFSSSCAMIVGSFINMYLISNWKILVNGKYFWLRSIGASTSGEAVFTILIWILAFTGKVSLERLIVIIIWSYLFKVIGSIIFAGPVNLIVKYLKKVEKTDAYDYHVNFNPFKLGE